jgi:GT2 family glycosyltransferase
VNISFVIIGKNEGFKLGLALRSVETFISEHRIADHEVVYVDSASSDGSIAMVTSAFPATVIVELTGEVNAAIARNAGAIRASGHVLFFMDGDMELRPGFPFEEALKSRPGDILFSGQIENKIYNSDFTEIRSTEMYYPGLKAPRQEIYFGGLFVISRALWFKFGGMRPAFVYGEDLDLSMRLSAQGYRLLRYPQVLVTHHTTKKKLTFTGLFGNACYSRGYLYRMHIGNRLMFRRILRSDPTVPAMVVCIIVAIASKHWWPLLVYALLVAFALLLSVKGSLASFFRRLWQQPIRDFLVLMCFLFYYPRNSFQEKVLSR